MRIRVVIDDAAIEAMSDEIVDQIESHAMRVQGAMAEVYHGIVISNLGPIGLDRPFPWAPLSNSAPHFYASKVGRTFATLFETGKLASCIRWENTDPKEAVVSVSDDDVSYATAHQYGYEPTYLPARPYFPFDPNTGETTPYTLNAMKETAEQELAAALYGE